jgi:hypothetical protein
MTTTQTPAPAQPVTTCPPSDVHDMIVRWSDVTAADLVVLDGVLITRERVHVYKDIWNRETGETFIRVDVSHRLGNGHLVTCEQRGDHYTAVRRYTEGISERDALVLAALDEAAADRDERARYARHEGRTDEEREHAGRAAQFRAERDRREAGRPECVITGGPWEKPGDCTTHAHRGTSGPPLTHFFGCWGFPEHHGCAVELIQRQSEENARLIGEKGHLERQLRDAQKVEGESR